MCGGGLEIEILVSTVVGIQHGNHDDQECCHGDRGEKHAIRMVGVQCQCPLPQMSQPLQ